MSPSTEISILFKERIIKKIAYERRAYESVDEKSLSYVMSRSYGGRLYWRRPNARSVALRGGLLFLRLAEFVTYNRAAIGGPSKRQPMNSLVSSCFGSSCYTHKPRLHAIGGSSKWQPMKSLVSSCLGSTQTPKVITLMYKKKIGDN